MEDLDKRGQQRNVLMWGILETVDHDQIFQAMEALFNKLLECPKDSPGELERVHRVLWP